MVKVSVMYPNTPGARFDHDYYRDKHMPLVKGADGGQLCKYYTVDKESRGVHQVRRPHLRWHVPHIQRVRREVSGRLWPAREGDLG